jgi:hypothetical protein
MISYFFDEPKDINLTLKGKHRCDLQSPEKAYGTAVKYCYEDDDGRLWAGNIEYESQVDYCPICGFKAIKSIQ